MSLYFFSAPDNLYQFEIFKFNTDLKIENLDFLNPAETEYIKSIKNEKRAFQYLHTRFWLKKTLSQLINKKGNEINFEYLNNGKPKLISETTSIDFNISHTDKFCAIAVSKFGDVGIDIEKIRNIQNIDSLIQKIFSPSEIKSIRQVTSISTQLNLFFNLWTCKEAIVKTANGSLLRDCQQIEINCENWKILALPKNYGPINQWTLKLFSTISEHSLSIAHRKLNTKIKNECI